MADSTKRVRVILEAEASAYDRVVRQQAQNTRGFAQQAQQLGQTLTRTVTPAAVGMGAAFVAASRDYQQGVQALRAGAGATGQSLDELRRSAQGLAGQVRADFGEVSTVMADLATRTGATGETLEALTLQVARLQELGMGASVETLSRTFGDWGVAVEDASVAVDELFRVSQMTGPTVDELGRLMVQYGAPLREFGFAFEDAALLMGKFQQEGVNTELVMGALRIALGKFAREQRDPQQALLETIDAIENAGSAAEANQLAFEVFGARAGTDMSRAIQEGRFALDDWQSALSANVDTVDAAYESTLSFIDRLDMMKDSAMAAAGPVADVGFAAAGIAAGLGPTLQGLGKLSERLGGVRGTGRRVAGFLTGPWGLALGAGAAALLAFSNRASEARAIASEFYSVLRDNQALAEVDQLDQVDLVAQFIDSRVAAEDLSLALAEAGLTSQDLAEQLRDGSLETSLLGFATAADEGGFAGQWFRESLGLLSLGMYDARSDAERLNDVLDALAPALEAARRQFAGEQVVAILADRFRDLSEAAEDNGAAMWDGVAAHQASMGAAIAHARAVEQSTSTHDSWHTVLRSVPVELDTAAQAYRDMVDPVQAYADADAALAEQVPESLADINAALEDQIAAQQDWADNFAQVAARVPVEFLPELERIATESPELLALMADASDAELVEFVRMSGQRGDEVVAEIETALSLLPEIGRRFGADTARALTDQLAAGVMTAADIAYAYTRALATGVNPLLIALGRQGIAAPQGPTGQTGIIGGVTAFNDGGLIPGRGPNVDTVPAMLTRGEYVVNRDAVDHYGVDTLEAINRRQFNTGGFVTPDDVPGPPSFAPYRTYIGQPGRATAETAYEATRQWVAENSGFGRGLTWARSQVGRPYLWGGVGPGGYDCSGFLSALTNVILGRDPHQRLFTSASIIGSGGAPYFRQGADSPFQIGSFAGNPGHVAGTLLGVNVESAGGVGVRVGGGARGAGWGRFTHRFGMVGLNAGGLVGELPYDYFNPDGMFYGQIREFADGGIVRATSGGILGRLGEAGHDELVTPLDGTPIPVEVVGNGGPVAGRFPPELQAEIATNMEMLRFEGLSPAQQLAEVQAAMAGTLEGTDEWVELLRQAQRLESQIADEQARVAAEAARTVQEARRHADSLGDQLDRLLDRRQQLLDREAQAHSRHADAVAEAHRRAARQIDGLIDARQRALQGAFGGPANPFTASWGNTAGALAGNVEDQIALFDEWADGIAELRDRGLSEAAIAELGLDNPAEIGQVRLLLRASQADLERLNVVLGDLQARTAEQAAMEADMLLGALGEAVTDAKAALADTLDQLRTDLDDELTVIGLEMAALGAESGRSYAERMAEALQSGLPAVLALAEQYKQALQQLPDSPAGSPAKTKPGGSDIDQVIAVDNHPGWGTGVGPNPNPGKISQAALSFFDSGGILSPGLTLAMNATGRDEYVLTADQLASLRPAGPSGGMQLPSEVILVVDGQQMRAHIEQVNDQYHRTNRTRTSMAGVR